MTHNHTPAQIAALDRRFANYSALLNDLVAVARDQLKTADPEITAAQGTLGLLVSLSPQQTASLAALAIVRIAQRPELADPTPPDPERI